MQKHNGHLHTRLKTTKEPQEAAQHPAFLKKHAPRKYTQESSAGSHKQGMILYNIFV